MKPLLHQVRDIYDDDGLSLVKNISPFWPWRIALDRTITAGYDIERVLRACKSHNFMLLVGVKDGYLTLYFRREDEKQ